MFAFAVHKDIWFYDQKHVLILCDTVKPHKRWHFYEISFEEVSEVIREGKC